MRAFFASADDVEHVLGLSKEMRAFFDAPADAAAADGPSLRVEVGRRILVSLARVALGRIGAMLGDAKDLDQRKAYLRVRLKWLRAGARSAEGLVSDQAHEAEIAQAQAELNATVSALRASKSRLVTMSDDIDQVRQVLDHADVHLKFEASTLRPTSMNVLATEGDAEQAREVKAIDVAVGGVVKGCVVIGHVPRAAMPRHVSTLDRAARELV